MGNNNPKQSKAKLYTAIGTLMILIAGIGAATALGGEIGAEGEAEVEPPEGEGTSSGNAELAADASAAIDEAEALQSEGELAAAGALDMEDVEGTEVEAEAAALVEALDELEAAAAHEAGVAVADLPEPELATVIVELETAIAGVEERLESLDAAISAEAGISAAGQEVAVSGSIS